MIIFRKDLFVSHLERHSTLNESEVDVILIGFNRGKISFISVTTSLPSSSHPVVGVWFGLTEAILNGAYIYRETPEPNVIQTDTGWTSREVIQVLRRIYSWGVRRRTEIIYLFPMIYLPPLHSGTKRLPQTLNLSRSKVHNPNPLAYRRYC